MRSFRENPLHSAWHLLRLQYSYTDSAKCGRSVTFCKVCTNCFKPLVLGPCCLGLHACFLRSGMGGRKVRFNLELQWAVEWLLWAAAMAPGQSALMEIVGVARVAEGERCERQRGLEEQLGCIMFVPGRTGRTEHLSLREVRPAPKGEWLLCQGS